MEGGRLSIGWLKELLGVVARSFANDFLAEPPNKSEFWCGDSRNRRCVRLGGSEFIGWLKFLPSLRILREDGSESTRWLKEEPKIKDEREEGSLGGG